MASYIFGTHIDDVGSRPKIEKLIRQLIIAEQSLSPENNNLSYRQRSALICIYLGEYLCRAYLSSSK